MGIIIHTDKNKTVNKIEDRDNIVRKRNDMEVFVTDATDDLRVPIGGAIYKYRAVDDSWILTAMTDRPALSFTTESIEISEDTITTSFMPTNNEVWDTAVIKDGVVYATEFDYTVDGNVVTCSFDKENEFEGFILRLTYAYGKTNEQLTALLDNKLTVNSDKAIVRDLVPAVDGSLMLGSLTKTFKDIKSKLFNGIDIFKLKENSTLELGTVQELRDLEESPLKIHLTGYHKAGDGSFGSNVFYKVEAGTTGVVFENANGVLYALPKGKPINIKHFGMNGSDTDAVNFQKAIDTALASNTFVYDTGGTYLITSEIDLKVPFIGSGRYSTVFRSAIDGDIENTTFLSRIDDKELFKYERPTVATFNFSGEKRMDLRGFRIEAREGTTVENDALVNIENCAGIRTSDTPTNRYNLSDISINGMHTSLDLKGWIADLDNIFITSSKMGLFASEFNNVSGSIKMENVERGLKIYEGTQITLNSYLNEGNIKMFPDTVDYVTAFIINGIYREGLHHKNENGMEIGCLVPIDGTVPYSRLECKAVELNGISMVQDIEFDADTYIKLDKVNGVELNGYTLAYSRTMVEVSENSKNVNNNIIYGKSYYTNTLADKNLQKPRNLWIDPFLERGFSGKRSDLTNATISQDFTKKLTGKSSTKIEATDDGEFKLKLQMKKYDFTPYFKDADSIVFGLWCFIPGGGSIDQLDTSTQPIFYAKENTDDGTVYGSSKGTVLLDEWFFITFDVYARADMNYIGFEIVFKDSSLAGEYILVDSIFMVNGYQNINKLRQFDLMPEKNPFAYISEEGYLKYKELPSDDYAVDFMAGDRHDNANAGVAGHFLERVCVNDNDRPSNGWDFITLPNMSALPTANSGVGTIWNDSNVMTLGD